MYSSDRFNFSSDEPEGLGSTEAELRFLRSVLSQLPAGVTVQDEHGRFLLVNDTAAVQLGAAANSADGVSAPHLDSRRTACREILGRGRTMIAEEKVTGERGAQTLLTAHRPARIGDQRVLISSSTDISEQKEFE